MSDLNLRIRLLLWHKLIAQITGSMALAYGKKGLSRDEAMVWVDQMKNVSADIRAVLEGRPPILDDKGRRVLGFESGHEVSGVEKISTTLPRGPRTARRKA